MGAIRDIGNEPFGTPYTTTCREYIFFIDFNLQAINRVSPIKRIYFVTNKCAVGMQGQERQALARPNHN